MHEDRAPVYLPAESIDWRGVRSAVVEVRQSLRYAYPGPIEELRQVLMLIPPDQIGGQHLLDFEITSSPAARPRYSIDPFGNRVCHIAIPRVERTLAFDVRFRVEQTRTRDQLSTPDARHQLTLVPTPLTEPTPAMQAVVDALLDRAMVPELLATRIMTWVHDHLRYLPDVTGVRTTAHDVFEQREGVCQDYAHLMIALCRLAGLPARYVSGHLLGEGAMHAWTHVLLPNEHDPATSSWRALDPTHGRRAGMNYVTVATGRDYADVSPTRGTYRAPYAGQLIGGSRAAGVLSLSPA